MFVWSSTIVDPGRAEARSGFIETIILQVLRENSFEESRVAVAEGEVVCFSVNQESFLNAEGVKSDLHFDVIAGIDFLLDESEQPLSEYCSKLELGRHEAFLDLASIRPEIEAELPLVVIPGFRVIIADEPFGKEELIQFIRAIVPKGYSFAAQRCIGISAFVRLHSDGGSKSVIRIHEILKLELDLFLVDSHRATSFLLFVFVSCKLKEKQFAVRFGQLSNSKRTR